MIWDVVNQFGIFKGVVYLFTCQVIWALFSFGANIIMSPNLQEKHHKKC